MTNKSPFFHLLHYVCALIAGAAADNIEFSDQWARKFWTQISRALSQLSQKSIKRVPLGPEGCWCLLSVLCGGLCGLNPPPFCAESPLGNQPSKEASTFVLDSDKPEPPITAKQAYWVCKCDPACLSSLSRRTA